MGGDGPVGCGWATGGAESPAGQGGPTRQRPVDMDEGPKAFLLGPIAVPWRSAAGGRPGWAPFGSQGPLWSTDAQPRRMR